MMGGGPMRHMRSNVRDEKAEDTGKTLQRLLVYLKPYLMHSAEI